MLLTRCYFQFVGRLQTAVLSFGKSYGDAMRYRLGRFLQLLGLCILPTAVAGNVIYPQAVTEGVMFVILGAGVGVFLLGYLLQGHKS